MQLTSTYLQIELARVFDVVATFPLWDAVFPFIALTVTACFALRDRSLRIILTDAQGLFSLASRRGALAGLYASWPVLLVSALMYGILYLPGQSISLSRLLFHSFYPGMERLGFRPRLVEALAWGGVNLLFAAVSWQFFCSRLLPLQRKVKRDIRKLRLSACAAKELIHGSNKVALCVGIALCTAAWQSIILLPFVTERGVTLIDATSMVALIFIFASLSAALLSRHGIRAAALVGAAFVVTALTAQFLSGILAAATIIVAIVPYYYELYSKKQVTIVSVISTLTGCGCAAMTFFVWSLRNWVPIDSSGAKGSLWLPVLLWAAPIPLGVYALVAAIEIRSVSKLFATRFGSWSAHSRRALSITVRAVPTILLLLVLVVEAVHARFSALSVPIAIAGVILMLLSYRRIRVVRWGYRALAVIVGLLVVRAIGQLFPQLDIEAGLQRTVPGAVVADAAIRRKSLDDFIDAWKRAHDSSNPNAPVILVAAAGGGIRAAAHVAASLADADVQTEGRFGNRLFAISGVSGGSLGAALWVAKKKDDLGVGIATHRRPEVASPETFKPFFDHDFISPVASRFLIWDFWKAMIPQAQSANSRDGLLVNLWADAYDSIRSRSSPGTNPFDASLAAVGNSNGNLPLLVLNSTSAADGKLAIRSSGGGEFPGEHMLDTGDSLGKSVLDSARFPIVSSVGVACSDQDIPLMKITAAHEPCKRGMYPVNIADGGYVDNSGSESLKYVVKSLLNNGVRAEQIYVIYVTSDPEADLPMTDGNRFSSATAVGTLLAVGSIFEQVRAERAERATWELQELLARDHLIRWSMSSRILFNVLAEQKKQTETGKARAKRIADEVVGAPLGWTLDEDAISDIMATSFRHAMLLQRSWCSSIKNKAEAGLCNALWATP